MRQIILAINALLKFKAYTLINVLGLDVYKRQIVKGAEH